MAWRRWYSGRGRAWISVFIGIFLLFITGGQAGFVVGRIAHRPMGSIEGSTKKFEVNFVLFFLGDFTMARLVLDAGIFEDSEGSLGADAGVFFLQVVAQGLEGEVGETDELIGLVGEHFFLELVEGKGEFVIGVAPLVDGLTDDADTGGDFGVGEAGGGEGQGELLFASEGVAHAGMMQQAEGEVKMAKEEGGGGC